MIASRVDIRIVPMVWDAAQALELDDRRGPRFLGVDIRIVPMVWDAALALELDDCPGAHFL